MGGSRSVASMLLFILFFSRQNCVTRKSAFLSFLVHHHRRSWLDRGKHLHTLSFAGVKHQLQRQDGLAWRACVRASGCNLRALSPSAAWPSSGKLSTFLIKDTTRFFSRRHPNHIRSDQTESVRRPSPFSVRSRLVPQRRSVGRQESACRPFVSKRERKRVGRGREREVQRMTTTTTALHTYLPTFVLVCCTVLLALMQWNQSINPCFKPLLVVCLACRDYICGRRV